MSLTSFTENLSKYSMIGGTEGMRAGLMPSPVLFPSFGTPL
ncbi:hypothetical protein RRSWK_00178 [Rhodopirellula sp. SWK7]|nr:hypothetical protein RRSWK_00178 [Rhodopirellula sp. SWK7]